MSTRPQILQFRVTLNEVEPVIWREIQVPTAYDFWALHVAIQDAMGWEDAHLHVFHVAKPKTRRFERIGIPDDAGFANGPPTLPGWEVPIAPYFAKVGASAVYEYDFGDDWRHVVTLQEILAPEPRRKYPRCVAGARACPPEDCGGAHGYEGFLLAIRDPDHEEHEHLREWIGGDFDPEAFKPGSVRFDDPQKRWKSAFGRRGQRG